MSDSGEKKWSSSIGTVLILFFVLIGLIVLLIILYKKLNKEANGEYTVRHIVYKEGGLRDQMRGATLTLETFLGVQLWPRGETDEVGEEMSEVRDEEGQVEGGSSLGSDSEGDDQEEEEEEDAEQSGNSKGEEGDDASNDNTSLEGSEAGEQTRLMDGPEVKGETGEKGEEREEKVGEGKGEPSGGTGLLIDLKSFSGSAIWSEEEGGEGKDSDVTAL